jgi:hypothetical protein
MVGNNPPVLLPIQRRVEVETREGGVKNPAPSRSGLKYINPEKSAKKLSKVNNNHTKFAQHQLFGHQCSQLPSIDRQLSP